MNALGYLQLTGSALKNGFIAQCWDALVVGVLWWIGLYLLKVQWAPVWAVLAAVLQFVPHLGPVLGTVGPVLAAAIVWKDWEHPLFVPTLYAGIVVSGWFPASALHHEAYREGAHVGVHSGADCLEFSNPFLGYLAGAAAACGGLCLSEKRARLGRRTAAS
jgi:hypothetical protein